MEDDDDLNRDYFQGYKRKKREDARLEARFKDKKLWAPLVSTQNVKVLKTGKDIHNSMLANKYLSEGPGYQVDAQVLRFLLDAPSVQAQFSRAAQRRRQAMKSRPKPLVKRVIRELEGQWLDTYEGPAVFADGVEQQRQNSVDYVNRDPIYHYLKTRVDDYDFLINAGQAVTNDTWLDLEGGEWQ